MDYTESTVGVAQTRQDVSGTSKAFDSGDSLWSDSEASKGGSEVPTPSNEDLEISESHYKAEDDVQELSKQTTLTPTDNEEQKDLVSDQVKSTEAQKLSSSLAKWMKTCNFDEEVINLVYWKSYLRTGFTFGGLMFILLTLQVYTLISTLACFSMAVLIVAFVYRIGLTVTNALQKTGSDHPFKELLESDLEISEETITWLSSQATAFLVAWINRLRRLFLIEDVLDSLKLGVILWFLSYIGGLFSLVTMATIACVMVFTLPKAYEDHQEQADKLMDNVSEKMTSTMSILQSKLPSNLQRKQKPE